MRRWSWWETSFMKERWLSASSPTSRQRRQAGRWSSSATHAAAIFRAIDSTRSRSLACPSHANWRTLKSSALPFGGSPRLNWGALPPLRDEEAAAGRERGRALRSLRLLDPHFELLGVRTLQERGHLRSDVGIGLPSPVHFLREHHLGLIWPADNELHLLSSLRLRAATAPNRCCGWSIAVSGGRAETIKRQG